MIEPPPAAIIASADACMPRNAPVRLTSSICCHFALSRLPSWPTLKMPALLKSTLSLPNSFTAVATAASPVLVAGHVEVDVARGVAELVGQRLALLVEEVADDDLGALGDQYPRVLGAHVAGAAADQCDLAVYTSHAGQDTLRACYK